MALTDLALLDQFAASPFPPDTVADRRTFYSPVDQVHAALLEVVKSATLSLDCAMYGFDDDDLATVIFGHLNDPNVTVRLTLDSSQAGGKHEKALLAAHGTNGNIIAIGRSEKGAIMHMKCIVLDGQTTVQGSTNWSDGGEAKQDNECTIIVDRAHAARATARISTIHAHMLGATTGGTP